MKNVLIVDDESDICFLLAGMLKKQYAVRYGHTLKEGFEKLEEQSPDILFLDINLPDGSGLDVVKEIKLKHNSINIIIISAYDNERARAYNEGADVFVSKPFNKHQILAALESLSSVDSITEDIEEVI